MKQTILITGSSGQVGSHLFEYFSKTNEVIGLDIKKSGIPIVDKKTTIGDIRDFNIVNKIVKKADIIIHTASQLNISKSIEDPILDADINITGTLNLLEAAKQKKGIKRFIYFSSSAVYGNNQYLPIDEKHPLKPVSPYGVSKLAGEKYCLLYNNLFQLPTIIVRPFNIYSSKENPKNLYTSIISKFTYQIQKNKPIIIFGGGTQMRDFVHVNDVVSFVEILLKEPKTIGEGYNLGSGKPISIIEIAKEILKIKNKKEEGNIIFKKKEEGKIEHSYADVKKSKKIGFMPKVKIEDAIKEIISFYKSS